MRQTTPIARAMGASPEVVRTSDTIDGVASRMRQTGVRRLPIVDEASKVVGAVTLDDLVVLLTSELGQTGATIRDNRGP